MELRTIRALNVLSLRAVNVDVPEGTSAILICGPNGAGKTSLIEGIRFALTGIKPRGIEHKKDLNTLITEGEKDGWVSIEVADGKRVSEYRISLKTGNFSDSSPPPMPHLMLTLSPQLFMKMEPAQRRKVLFARTGISLAPEDIVRDLLADGLNEDAVAAVRPTLSAGLERAAETARELFSEARGAWQAITGEKYGDVKAKDWKAHAPVTWDDPNETKAELEKVTAEAAAAVRDRDALLNDQRAAARGDHLRAAAAKLEELETMHGSYAGRITTAEETLASMTNTKRGNGITWTAKCPSCGILLESQGVAHLVLHGEEGDPAPSDAVVKDLRRKIETLKESQAKAATQAADARAAKLALAQLPEAPTASEIKDAQDKVAALSAALEIANTQHREATEATRAAMEADNLTAKAQKHYQEVQNYTALGMALTKLPAKHLKAALDTINEALNSVSSSYDCRVTLGEDMDLRYGTMRYALASESQQWRMDLALGIALAQKDGGIVLMDRFDMVQPSHRGAILRMIGSCGVQVVIGATLKEPPQLPEDYLVYWIGAR